MGSGGNDEEKGSIRQPQSYIIRHNPMIEGDNKPTLGYLLCRSASRVHCLLAYYLWVGPDYRPAGPLH
eukprot:1376799-Amorphochlora_amoeboformis.AAC.1